MENVKDKESMVVQFDWAILWITRVIIKTTTSLCKLMQQTCIGSISELGLENEVPLSKLAMENYERISALEKMALLCM